MTGGCIHISLWYGVTHSLDYTHSFSPDLSQEGVTGINNDLLIYVILCYKIQASARSPLILRYVECMNTDT